MHEGRRTRPINGMPGPPGLRVTFEIGLPCRFCGEPLLWRTSLLRPWCVWGDPQRRACPARRRRRGHDPSRRAPVDRALIAATLIAFVSVVTAACFLVIMVR